MEQFPGMLDYVCVSQYNKEMDERVVLFVKMRPGNKLTEDVKLDIKRVIEEALTVEHVPEVIIKVPDIPVSKKVVLVLLLICFGIFSGSTNHRDFRRPKSNKHLLIRIRSSSS